MEVKKYSIHFRSILLMMTQVVVFFCSVDAMAGVQFFDYSKGLSNEKITAICKDRSGLMWIGTEGGFNQFNGYEFVEIGAFKGQYIKSVYYDSVQNIIWVGSTEGLFLFNVETHTVLHASARMENPAVSGIGAYRQYIVVVFSNGEVLCFSRDGKVKKVFSAKGARLKSADQKVNSFAFDDNGYVYLLLGAKYYQLVSIQIESGVYHKVTGLEGFTVGNISSGNGNCIINYNNNKIGLYTQARANELLFLDVPDREEEDPTRIIYETKGDYFISHRENYGHYRLGEKDKRWEGVEKVALNRLLKAKNIRCFYFDANHVLWIGTSKGLLSVSRDETYPFKRIFSGPNKTVSIRQIVAGHHDQLFIATYDGIYDYNKKSGAAILLSNIPKDVGFPLYARTLYYDKGGYLYAGTESNSNYFFRYNLKTKTFETAFFEEDPSGINISSVFSLIVDRKGTIWMATDVGLASFNPLTKKIKVHVSDKFSVGARRLMYLQPSGYPNKFLACGKGGAFLVDITFGLERTYDASALLASGDTEYLFATDDADHNVWLATQKYGIVMIPAKGKEPMVLNESDGLASNEVYSILWENKNIAWIGTSNGLSRYDVSTKTFHNYLYENGIADDEFNQHSFFRASDSLMYMGGINGITYFNPQQFNPVKNKESIFLANITRWGSEDKKKQISFRTDDIVMNPTDYLITLNFGLSDYTSSSGNSFYYKIDNLSNNWISLGTENTLMLNGLAPGVYQIRVKGMNKFGVQSDNMLKFSMLVKERFYKTSWFYVLLSVVIISIIYLYFRWRLSRITQRQLLRAQISSNLHDEVGSLLTQIVISTDNALYAIHDIEEKDKRLSKISALSRNAINTMSDVLWSIDSRNDFVGNLTDRMREHAELMFADKGIELDFEFTNTRVLKGIDSQLRQELYLIFKETVHNIIKHSKATMVKVRFKQEGRGFELMVTNNNHREVSGATKMNGQGIKNMHMRAKKMKASCTISSNDDWFVVLIHKN